MQVMDYWVLFCCTLLVISGQKPSGEGIVCSQMMDFWICLYCIVVSEQKPCGADVVYCQLPMHLMDFWIHLYCAVLFVSEQKPGRKGVVCQETGETVGEGGT